MQSTTVLFRSAALGDFVMAVPAINIARKVFEHDHIILITIQSANKDQQKMVEKYSGGKNSVPWVDLIKPSLIDEYFVIQNTNDIKEMFSLRSKLSKYNVARSILLLDPCAPWLGRIKKIILMSFLTKFAPVLGWKGEGSLSNSKSDLKRSGLLKHHVYGPMQFLSEIASTINRDYQIEFQSTPSLNAKNWAESFADGLEKNKKRILIGIFPGGIFEHKIWPVENYIKLIDGIKKIFPDSLYIIFGTGKDRNICEEIKKKSDAEIIDLVGKISIEEAAALLSYIRIVISNDGGGAHLADAVGSTVISLIPGIEYDDSIEPYNSRHLAIRANVDCAPCYSFRSCPTQTYDCMRKIDVNKVLEIALMEINKLP